MAELGIILPMLLVIMLAGIDLGRLVYTNQLLSDLTREAAMLVSRGATSNEAFAATFRSDAPLDIQANGGVIITKVRRHDANDSQPWVFGQERAGALNSASRVGTVGGHAVIPNITTIAPGVTIMVVEILQPFTPVFSAQQLSGVLYPPMVYEAAYF